MPSYKLVKRIFVRCLLEFLPPLLLGVAWAILKWDVEWAAVNFSTAFVPCALVWWNYLRIQYQQTVRDHQDDASGQIQKVLNGLTEVAASLRDLSSITNTVTAHISPNQADEISKIVKQIEASVAESNRSLGRIFFYGIGRPISRGALGGLSRQLDKT